jgi:aerobic-type carbon monoxide dehydrogenase small subunit (CoxS/CutS family)
MLGFVCNGVTRELADGDCRLLIEVLREDFGLTGTKLGCGTGDCGACTVILDGEAVNSCLVYASECAGREVDTIEYVGANGIGALVAEAFAAAGAVQCGICTPGFIVTASKFLADGHEDCTREDVEVALSGNLCRCTGYLPIVDAVLDAASRVRDEVRG